jgi:Zn-dependent peptidase ImmA (M78 family)
MVRTLSHASPTEIIGEFTRDAPVNVRGLAEAFGLDVRGEPLTSDISGKIEKRWFGNTYVVTYNSTHSTTRQRFTIAHEIAHFVLHRDLIGDGIVDNAMYRSTPQNDPIETQANSYAATILMPAPLVREKFREGVKSFTGMATTFDVSPEVARIRMKELQLG